jgi:hypothetical protein
VTVWPAAEAVLVNGESTVTAMFRDAVPVLVSATFVTATLPLVMNFRTFARTARPLLL